MFLTYIFPQSAAATKKPSAKKTHGHVNSLEVCYLVCLLITSFHFFSRQVLANFSALSTTTPPIRIQKTELRGITIDQLLVPLPPEV